MTIVAALLQQTQQADQDLTLNWIILGVLLAVAAVLGVVVVRRRMREQDVDYDV